MNRKEKNIGGVGYLGEDIGCSYLKNKGFHVKDRNFRKPFGEIDIVAEREGEPYFIEIKTVTCEIFKDKNGKVTCENKPVFEPEENVTPKKAERLRRAIESYLVQWSVSREKDWHFAILAVYIDRGRRRSIVRFIDNVAL